LLEDYLILCLQFFPRSSPYLLDISEAVVEVAESGALKDLGNSLTFSYKCLASESDDHTDRLRLSSFRGLFGITVGTSTIVLLLFCTCPREKIRIAPEEAAADERTSSISHSSSNLIQLQQND
jgi:ionotropic glutamate receptor NMDA 1/ionotropic glutamate receptor